MRTRCGRDGRRGVCLALLAPDGPRLDEVAALLPARVTLMAGLAGIILVVGGEAEAVLAGGRHPAQARKSSTARPTGPASGSSSAPPWACPTGGPSTARRWASRSGWTWGGNTALRYIRSRVPLHREDMDRLDMAEEKWRNNSSSYPSAPREQDTGTARERPW